MNCGTSRQPRKTLPHNRISFFRDLRGASLSSRAQRPRPVGERKCGRSFSGGNIFHSVRSASPPPRSPARPAGLSTRRPPVSASESLWPSADGAGEGGDGARVRNPYIRSVLRGTEQRSRRCGGAQCSREREKENQERYLGQERLRYQERELSQERYLGQERLRNQERELSQERYLGQERLRNQERQLSQERYLGQEILRNQERQLSQERYLGQERLRNQERQQQETSLVEVDMCRAASATAQSNETNLFAAEDARASRARDETFTHRKNGAEGEDERDPRAYLYSPSQNDLTLGHTGAFVPARYSPCGELCVTKAAPAVVLHDSFSKNKDSSKVHLRGSEYHNDGEKGTVVNFLVGPGTEIVEGDSHWVAEAETFATAARFVARVPPTRWLSGN